MIDSRKAEANSMVSSFIFATEAVMYYPGTVYAGYDHQCCQIFKNL